MVMEPNTNPAADSITGGITHAITLQWNYCPHCGCKLETEWKYCPGCGLAIEQVPDGAPLHFRPTWPVYSGVPNWPALHITWTKVTKTAK